MTRAQVIQCLMESDARDVEAGFLSAKERPTYDYYASIDTKDLKEIWSLVADTLRLLRKIDLDMKRPYHSFNL